MVTSGSYNGPGTDQESNEDGLPYMHAFSILQVFELSVDGGTERLVQIRNPWGIEKYHGAWSDKDERWSDELLAKVNHTLVNDGKFHMGWKEYVEQMEYTDISFNTFGKQLSYFLFENDDEVIY